MLQSSSPCLRPIMLCPADTPSVTHLEQILPRSQGLGSSYLVRCSQKQLLWGCSQATASRSMSPLLLGMEFSGSERTTRNKVRRHHQNSNPSQHEGSGLPHPKGAALRRSWHFAEKTESVVHDADLSRSLVCPGESLMSPSPSRTDFHTYARVPGVHGSRLYRPDQLVGKHWSIH